MRLSLAPIGEVYRIKAIWSDEETTKLLEVFGFAIDSEIIVKLKSYDDTFIVEIKDKRMAIGEEIASKIIVEPWL